MRTHVICEVSHEVMEDQDCLNCAACMGLQPVSDGTARHCRFNYPMMAALLAPQVEREHAGISSTMIATKCLRQATWQMTRPFAQYPGQLWAALDGTFMHKGLEVLNEDGVFAEGRLVKRLPSGHVITGAPDRYIRERETIEDYKSKEGTLFTRAPWEYEVQLNIYGWMIRTGCAILKTGEVFQGPVSQLLLYPLSHKAPGIPVPVRLWSDQQVEEFIESRMRHYLAIQEDPEYLAPRAFRDPRREKFCTDWCPFAGRCITAGGDFEGDL